MAGNEQDIRGTLIKSQEEEPEKNSVVDALIDLLPFEIPVPHYKFCGSGTKLAERIERGDIGINPLDESCRQHDLADADLNSDRHKAYRVLAQYNMSSLACSPRKHRLTKELLRKEIKNNNNKKKKEKKPKDKKKIDKLILNNE